MGIGKQQCFSEAQKAFKTYLWGYWKQTNNKVTGQWEATLLNWVLMEVFPLNNMITSTLYKVSEKRLYIWLSLYAITDIHESLS